MQNEVDLHSYLKVQPALTPRAAIATDTATVGATVDRLGYESLEFVIASGVLTDGTYTPALWESDDSGMSGEAAVAAADLIGTIAAATFAATDDAATKKLGYKGSKRYVRLKLTSASTSSGGFLAAVAVLASPRYAPVT